MFRVYLDLDGVLADFDKRAMELLDGRRPRDYEDQEGAEALWEKLYTHGDFFESLEPMPDAFDLLEGVMDLGFHPTILTGIPKREGGPGAVNAELGKREMVRRNFGERYRVIACRSKDKRLHMEKPGDVLIDDWHKYMPLWKKHGGHFILHTSADDSLSKLKAYKEEVHDEWQAYTLSRHLGL